MGAHYLVSRAGTYYFNRAVPAKLVSLIGKKVWRETLKARTLAEAEVAVGAFIDHTNIEIRLARQELLRQCGAAVLLSPDERAVVQESGGFRGLRHHTALTAKALQFTSAAASMIEGVAASPRLELAREGLRLDDLTEELAAIEARAVVLRSEIARNQTILSRAGLKKSETLDDADVPDMRNAGSITIQELAERFAGSNNLIEQHADQYRYPTRLFTEFHGPLTLDKITKAHIRDWRDDVGKLPRSTSKGYRSLSMRQAITKADQEQKREGATPIPRITPQTGAKHLAAIKTLMKFAVAEGYLNVSPADGLKYTVTKGKKSGQARRNPFNQDQLRTLFATLAEECEVTADERWIPMLAVYQGMRLEEVCQLLKTDVKQEGEMWVINITDADPDQRVKNVASVRTVPLHPALIKAGLLDHLKRSPGPRLFATLKPDQRGRLGGPYGKRFGRHLRLRAKIADKATTFHSLRHVWRDAARAAEVPLEVVYRLGGWSDSGNAVAAGYGSGVPLSVLSKWLAVINPPIGPSAVEV